jgi:broad specificity phosphatase PhoE
MRYIFARHGESTTNVQKILSNHDESDGLTEKGIKQAEDLATRLSTEGIVRMYASPILRAQQTGRIVADKLNLSMITEDALREGDCGSLEGRGDSEAWAVYIKTFTDWMKGENREVAIAGGESFQDISDRFMPFMQGLIKEFHGKDGSLLLVSHGGVLYTMLPLLLKNISYEFVGTRMMNNTSLMIAEEKDGSLFCREWCGERVEEL